MFTTPSTLKSERIVPIAAVKTDEVSEQPFTSATVT